MAALGKEPEILGFGISADASQGKPADASGFRRVPQIRETPVGQRLSFAADGLVALRLNDETPLFFKASGVLSIVPDVKGTLSVLMGKETHTIQVIDAASAPAQAGPAVKEKSTDQKAAALAPGQVTEVKIFDEKGGIRIFWKAPATGDVDHYVIYRLGSSKPWNVGETKETQFFLKATHGICITPGCRGEQGRR